MFDPTPEQLAGLTPEARDVAVVLLNHFREAGVPLIITAQGGRRNDTEQRQLVQMGRSRTLQSAHLTGRAFDFDVFGYQRDQVPPLLWQYLGQLAEGYGLIWGGRWGWDYGHIELPPDWA